jgi:hypothetical protein
MYLACIGMEFAKVNPFWAKSMTFLPSNVLTLLRIRSQNNIT